ncbi:MAG: hypothetical protein ACK559_32440, partial [bacterium]
MHRDRAAVDDEQPGVHRRGQVEADVALRDIGLGVREEQDGHVGVERRGALVFAHAGLVGGSALHPGHVFAGGAGRGEDQIGTSPVVGLRGEARPGDGALDVGVGARAAGGGEQREGGGVG